MMSIVVDQQRGFIIYMDLTKDLATPPNTLKISQSPRDHIRDDTEFCGNRYRGQGIKNIMFTRKVESYFELLFRFTVTYFKYGSAFIVTYITRSEEHTSELQSLLHL